MDIDRQTFINLFKDLISRLYDRVAVETHPLAVHYSSLPNTNFQSAEQIRSLVQDGIEQLRPEGEELPLSPEWRPYLVLRKRYIEGQDPGSIAASLFIGDRQFRRDHSRALQALSTWMWNKHFQAQTLEMADETGYSDDKDAFEFHAEDLDLNDVLTGIQPILERRLEMENVRLVLRTSASPLSIRTDRVLLRQIILSLLNYILHIHDHSELTILTEVNQSVSLQIRFSADEQWSSFLNDESDALEFVRRLCTRLPASLEEGYPPVGEAGPAAIRLYFRSHFPGRVLIIDDQPAAQKMYQRYLSQSDLEVVGITDPSLVAQSIEEKQPVLIILDVMMPHIDGWEVLQNLQLDAKTRKIPVIVCSAWGEPELAASLGAAAFLKKPVIQKELLHALKNLELVQD